MPMSPHWQSRLIRFSRTPNEVWLVVLLIAALCLESARAEDPRITLLGLQPGGRPRLQVSGETNSVYTIEASTDMRDWWVALDNTSTNGVLEVTHESATNFNALMYRGRTVLPAPVASVARQTYWNTKTLVTTNGGQAELWAPGGIRFRLTVPPYAVPRPVVITMTRLTNFANVGYGDLLPVGVQIEPEGLRFISPALLEIQFPTNIDWRHFASLAFAGNGSEYRLTPDRVGTNRVQIPLMHLSGYQTSPLSELQLAAASAKYIKDNYDRMSHEMAVLLATERQKQLLGLDNSGDPDLKELLRERIREFFDNYLKPLLDETSRNCELYKTVIVRALGLERQLQLLSNESSPDSTILDAIARIKCPGLEHCVQDILDECAAGRRSTEALQELIAVRRAVELGYGNCTVPDLEHILDSCGPQKWVGSMQYHEAGTVDRSIPYGAESLSYVWDSSGTVRSISELRFPWDGSVQIMVTIPAASSGDYTYVANKTIPEAAEGCLFAEPTHTSVLGSIPTVTTNNFTVRLFFDNTYKTNGLNVSSLSSSVSGRKLTITYPGYCTDVEAAPPPEYTSGNQSVSFGFAPLDLSGQTITTNLVDIHLTGGRTVSTIPVQWDFKLNLQRVQ